MAEGKWKEQFESPEPYWLDVLRTPEETGKNSGDWMFIIRSRPRHEHEPGNWMAEFNGACGGEDGARAFVAALNKGSRLTTVPRNEVFQMIHTLTLAEISSQGRTIDQLTEEELNAVTKRAAEDVKLAMDATGKEMEQ